MADSESAAALSLFAALHKDSVSLLQEAMRAEERMHAASLEAQKGLLHHALKGAQNCSPEQFEVLVTALKEVSLASINAEREVALGLIDNGRAAIKAFDSALQGAIALGGQVATARMAQLDRKVRAEEVRAEAKAKAAEAEAMKAEAAIKAKAEKIKKSFKAKASA